MIKNTRIKRPIVDRGDIIDLWDFLKRGDDNHKEWLLEAIECFFSGRQRPPVK